MFLRNASPHGRSRSHGRSAPRTGRNVVEQFAYLVLLPALLVLNSALLRAQSGETWIDLRVVPKSLDFKLNTDDRTATQKSSPLSIYRVVNAQGPKLWLETEGDKPRSGWVLADQVVPVYDAIDFFGRQIRIKDQGAYPFLMRSGVWYESHELDNSIADYTEAIRLDPTYPWAYKCRAAVWQTNKDFDKAIEDYDTAVRLEPGSGSSLADRALAWLKKKDLKKAAADFDAAVNVDPKNAYAIYARSVFLVVTRGHGATDGFKVALKLAGWRDDVSCYAALMGYFAAQNEGNREQATTLLDEAPRNCDIAAWPYPIVKYLRGEIDEPKLMTASSEGDRMTEARCFLALKALQEGEKDVARGHFRWVTENGNASYTEFAISLIELDRLEKN